MNKEYFHTSNKDTIIYEVKIVPIINKQGTIVGHILLTNDVTSTKEAEYRTEESKKKPGDGDGGCEYVLMGIRRVQNGVRDLAWKLCFQKWYVLGAIVTDASSAGLRSVKEPFSRLINKEVPAGQLTVRVFNEQEGEFRHYESRMRLSTEHFGKLQIVGTLLDVTEKLRMAKRHRIF